MRIVPSRALARGLTLMAVVTAAASTHVTPLSAQELALVHEDGDRVRVAGMPVRDFASGLRLEVAGGELGTFAGACFVALADSEGNVWQEHVSRPFEGGGVEGACAPRSPLLPEGRLPEHAMIVPLEASIGPKGFPGGSADWTFIMKRVDQSIPRLDERFLKIGDIPGESQITPPSRLEGVDYEWVALFFFAGPSEEGAERLGRDFSTRPVMILVGAN